MDHHGGAAVKDLEVVKRCYPGESGGKSGKKLRIFAQRKNSDALFLFVCITESRKFYEKKIVYWKANVNLIFLSNFCSQQFRRQSLCSEFCLGCTKKRP